MTEDAFIIHSEGWLRCITGEWFPVDTVRKMSLESKSHKYDSDKGGATLVLYQVVATDRFDGKWLLTPPLPSESAVQKILDDYMLWSR